MDTSLQEFFNVSKDHCHGLAPSRVYPAEISENMPLFKSFTRRAHTVGLAVLECLATQLGLGPETFSALNDFNKTAGDHVRLTKKIPHATDSNQIGLMAREFLSLFFSGSLLPARPQESTTLFLRVTSAS